MTTLDFHFSVVKNLAEWNKFSGFFSFNLFTLPKIIILLPNLKNKTDGTVFLKLNMNYTEESV